jgi:aryl-phospho-beta-D-glucosidase BglC (GH1 family)
MGLSCWKVNLGGWLVLEPCITSSLFKDQSRERVIDEYTFCKVHRQEKACVMLECTFIIKEELKELTTMSITHVRILVRYWMFDI